jgi:hypothetical protein
MWRAILSSATNSASTAMATVCTKGTKRLSTLRSAKPFRFCPVVRKRERMLQPFLFPVNVTNVETKHRIPTKD